MNGILIAIEGICGSGKSTLGKYLEEELVKEGRRALRVTTREEEKEHIFRAVTEGYELDPNSPAYMFFFQVLHAHKVDRARQLLEAGNIVIVNRWDLSFFVHTQNFGFLTEESDHLREEISRLAFNGLTPNLGIYLDVSVEKALDRRLWRGDKISDLEAERRFYDIVTASYKALTTRHGWQIIDANNGFEEVRQVVLRLVQRVVKQMTR